jgi:hypothetical protein
MPGGEVSYAYPDTPKDDRQKAQCETQFRLELAKWMTGSIVGKEAPDAPKWMNESLLKEILLLARKTGRRWKEDEIAILLNWLEVDLFQLGTDKETRGQLDSIRQSFKLKQDIAKNTDIRDLEKEVEEMRKEMAELRK